MTTLDEAEAEVWSTLGVAPVEHRLHLATLDIDVRVQEVGPADGRPAVFVHGASVSGTSWSSLVAGLDGLRCLLLDRPGCGRSDPLPAPRDVDTFVEVSDRLVVDVLDALDVATAHVVGTSMGGHPAIRTAAGHPDRVDRLLLFGWCLGSPGATAPLWIRANTLPGVGRLMNAAPLPRRVVVAMLRRFGMARAIDEHGLTDEAIDVLVALYRDTDTLRNETADGPDLTSLRGGWDPRLVHDDDLLGRIAAPTCLVWGRDDPFGDADAAVDLAGRIPNANLHLLDRTGHAPWLDEPDRCNAITQAFLQA